MLTDTVTIAHCTGVNESGDPAFGAQTTIKARVEHGTKVLLGPSGEAIDYEQIVATCDPIAQTDRVWLPGDNTADNNAARRPITVKRATTFDGVTTLYEAYL